MNNSSSNLLPTQRVFTLPWPPSINRYFAEFVRGGRVIKCVGSKGTRFRVDVQAAIWSACQGKPTVLTGPLALRIAAYPPDRRARDCDNILKPLLDSLTHAGVWEDDSQVKDLRVEMLDSMGKPGSVKVSIWEMGE